MNKSSIHEEDSVNQEFAARAGALLREGADHLDAATLSRLNRARQAALAEFDRRGKGPVWMRLGGPAAAFASMLAALAITVALVQQPLRTDAVPGATVVHADLHAGDMEVLLADENLDMLDDVDFFDWVEQEDNSGGSPQDLPG